MSSNEEKENSTFSLDDFFVLKSRSHVFTKEDHVLYNKHH